jgi:plastocyanin
MCLVHARRVTLNRIALITRLSLLVCLLLLVGCQPIQPEAPAPAPQEVTVLAGAGQDVVAINGFFPQSVHIRAGDTVTWKIGSDEPHTATFLSGAPFPPDPVPIPGGGPTDIMLNPVGAFASRAPDAPVETYSGTDYRNSGLLSNGKVVPPNESYSLSFDTPGTYKYNCLIHPAMVGEVVVEAATATDLPAQADIDAQAAAEMAPLAEMAEAARVPSTNPEMVRSEPGGNGSTFWYVPNGVTGVDSRIEIYDFFPKDVTIKKGDTVIWTSTFFHAIAFFPGQPAPEFIIPVEQAGGPPLLQINPVVAFPSKPAGEYDGTQPFGSGLMGVPANTYPGGTTFALTFTEVGTHEYVCGIHRALGMKGTVTVVE